MQPTLDLNAFKARNNISDADWQASGCDWDELSLIADDFLANHRMLEQTAQFCANVIQAFPDVHSVRWRVKDVEHLMEKIVRKKAKQEKKYLDISVDNYMSVITDLVGVRALHLFKEDYLSIDANIRSNWAPEEMPIIYLRQGDARPGEDTLKTHGFRVEDHPAGYRSVHYIVSSQALKKKVFAEVQVRTIFEEGWSEIDHRVRYPNHLDDTLVNYFLQIFNRMAGSADEMGSFVKGLVLWKDQSKESLELAEREKAEALRALEQSIAELEQAKGQHAIPASSIDQMKNDLGRLRALKEAFPAAYTEPPPHIKSRLPQFEKMAALAAALNRSASDSAGEPERHEEET